MTAKDRKGSTRSSSSSSGEQLVIGGTSTRRRRGRHELAIDKAAAAARAADLVQPWHVGGISTARALARSLDTAERESEGWLVARLASELRQTLDALAWLPREADASDLDDLVALFGSDPPVGDSAKP